jgi:hypothetical protein
MNTAGTAAHRWGWLVNRVESSTNVAQPRANPHSTAPVTSFSSGLMKGAAARRRAASSPRASEPATTQPMGPRDADLAGIGPGPLSGDVAGGVGVGVIVTMGSIQVPLASREHSDLHVEHVPSLRQ